MQKLTYVPEPVQNELNTLFGYQPYIGGRGIEGMTKTVKLDYRKVTPIKSEVEIIDPVTFEARKVTGSTHEMLTCYYARVSGRDVIEVLTSGPMVIKKT